MSNINANVADYLKQIEALTNTNLKILKTINESFFTKKNHLYAELDENTTFVIPSFISLENKINMLQENFNNLVHCPETGEAHFNFNGNTRAIELRKYNHSPESISLSNISNYYIENNNIFKDFLTPVPYINIELPTIPNDITEVNVKKIVVKSDSLKTVFKNKLAVTSETSETVSYNTSVNENYSTIYKALYTYKNGVDYDEYDTVYKLPTHKNVGTGSYIIESVISDEINDDLEELITLKLRGSLTYKLFDETIERSLQVGDELINYNASGKVVITDIVPSTSTITVKVVNGEYLNFIGTDSYNTNNGSDIHELSRLRFYDAVDFSDNKYVKIPLEEDQYIFIAIAPINQRLNIQSSWGTGLIIDTFSLINSTNNLNFKKYYDNNVQNIGDIIFEMTSVVTSPITSLAQDTFNKLTKFKPSIDSDDLTVMQINKHLNDSATVKNIRKAYNQKKAAEINLSQVNEKIDDINNKIAETTFNDTEGIRQAYMSELSELNRQKNDLLLAINNAINEITLSVNTAEVPIENAKYRIRGFYTPNLDEINNTGEYIYPEQHVIGIEIQYRYKNISSETGNAVSLANKNDKDSYIYSDWNLIQNPKRNRIVSIGDEKYLYKYEETNETKNEPSYNQIDIPISQGETVDIRVRLVYDYGQPYVCVMSDWSETINISFPDEFIQDVTITSILEEVADTANINKFNSVLQESGVNKHLGDTIIDQNITYYHQPENIASGFYTEERKIIPLKDKLVSLTNDLAALKTDIMNQMNSSYEVKLSVGTDNTQQIFPDMDNYFYLEPYSNFQNVKDSYTSGAYTIVDGIVYTTINLSIKNTGENVLKLYSLFPGGRSTIINDSKTAIVNKEYYTDSDYVNGGNIIKCGVRYKYPSKNERNEIITASSLQTQNQFITFRVVDMWNGTKYYSHDATINSNDSINSKEIEDIPVMPKDDTEKNGLVIYPFLSNQYGLCLDSDVAKSYKIINPNEEVIIPIHCEYRLPSTPQLNKTMSFDLRTNLYSNEFTNYLFTVVAKTNGVIDKSASKNIKASNLTEYQSTL